MSNQALLIGSLVEMPHALTVVRHAFNLELAEFARRGRRGRHKHPATRWADVPAGRECHPHLLEATGKNPKPGALITSN
jgi:hypothetical protein